MNNKILARIMAAVMAVAMLGSVSFAADTVDVSDSVENQPSNTIKTVMAFKTASIVTDGATAAPASDDDILYLAQGDAYPTTTIDIRDGYLATMTEGEKIWVRYGGDTSAPATVCVYTAPAAEVADVAPYLQKITVHKTYKGSDGVEYKDVVAASYTIPVRANTVINSYGIRFGKYTENASGFNYPYVEDGEIKNGVLGTGSTGEQTTEANIEGAETTITGDSEGEFTYTAVIVGVTAKQADGLAAHIYATYVED